MPARDLIVIVRAVATVDNSGQRDQTAGFETTLTPSGTFDPRTTARLPESMVEELRQRMNQFERLRLDSGRYVSMAPESTGNKSRS